MVFYLLNAHIESRKIWLCVHGETDFDLSGVLGGDPDLNERGVCFSKELHDFISSKGGVCDRIHERGSFRRVIGFPFFAIQVIAFTRQCVLFNMNIK